MIPSQCSANFQFSSIWPPIETHELSRINKDGYSYTISVDSLGRIIFAYTDSSGTEESVFQPIDPDLGHGPGTYTLDIPPGVPSRLEVSVKMEFRWDEDHIVFTCEGTLVELNHVAKGARLKVKPRVRALMGINSGIDNLDTSVAKTHDEYLFLETVKELEAKLNKGDSYSLIKASGLMRQLLVDGDKSLALKIAKHTGVKLSFALRRNEIDFSCGLDELLASEVLVANNNASITIRKLLLFYANVLGGVHLGKPLPKHPEHSELLIFDKQVQVDGKAISERTMAMVGEVVLNALWFVADALIILNTQNK